MDAYAKLEKCKDILKNLGSVAIAFSGGVDSTFLLKVACEQLGERAIAVTARSSTYPKREFDEAVRFAGLLGTRHIVIESEELDIPNFAGNPANRCYYCKHELFAKVKEAANREGIEHVADGSNLDDLLDYRPGQRAAKEYAVATPLKDAELTKEDIRLLSREMGLPTWDKPAFACLASRFPYGQTITKEKLKMVEDAEQFLLDIGFRQVRVRHHGELARIEVDPGERGLFFEADRMDRVYNRLKKIGFIYVSLDLKGYRTGSMNETLSAGERMP